VLSGEVEKTNVTISWIDESNSDTFLKGEYYAKICIGFLREIFYKAMQEIDRICGDPLCTTRLAES
jgi:hypothetical protein